VVQGALCVFSLFLLIQQWSWNEPKYVGEYDGHHAQHGQHVRQQTSDGWNGCNTGGATSTAPRSTVVDPTVSNAGLCSALVAEDLRGGALRV
jgi:hypothetical protein